MKIVLLTLFASLASAIAALVQLRVYGGYVAKSKLKITARDITQSARASLPGKHLRSTELIHQELPPGLAEHFGSAFPNEAGVEWSKHVCLDGAGTLTYYVGCWTRNAVVASCAVFLNGSLLHTIRYAQGKSARSERKLFNCAFQIPGEAFKNLKDKFPNRQILKQLVYLPSTGQSFRKFVMYNRKAGSTWVYLNGNGEWPKEQTPSF